MTRMFYDHDADLAHLRGKTVAVLGYGSQGHAQAQNLRDSGVSVVIGLREGSRRWDIARQDGFDVLDPNGACARADVIQMLVPDEKGPEVYEQAVRPNLRKGKALVFSHGFNIHFAQIVPPADVDVFMIAPKAPGHMVRRLYVGGQGTPCLLAIHQDVSGDARAVALAYAKGIGGTRAGVIETTFREETESDLFGEQAVLCGGISELMKAGFETLVAAGYQPEVAYFETVHEMKLIVDLIYEGGLGRMWYSVSDTAQYGGLTRGPVVVDGATRARLRGILEAIQNGTFAREWVLENQAHRPSFNALTERDTNHQVEQVGSRLREMMPWLKAKD